MVELAKRYKVVRHFQRSGRKFAIARNVSLVLAQAMCSDPNTSSRTCTTIEGKRRTRRYGPWFDGYVELR